MKLLLDTQLLLWTSGQSNRLPRAARRLLEDARNELIFSAASIWEIAIKSSRRREDFEVEPRVLRRNLLSTGYIELSVTSDHAVAIDLLPPIHKDPFDRLLLAQALHEGLTLLTTDQRLAEYPGPVRKV